MKTKNEIVSNWLPRYTGRPLKNFGKFILLSNFIQYVNLFSQKYKVSVVGSDKPMPNASANGITIINFGIGSSNAATIIDLLCAINPKAILFLGKCGGLKKKNKVGDLILPIGAVRGEGTSDNYLPSEVPALPAFSLQKAVSNSITKHNRDYWTGTVYTTNRRVWEHDNKFKEYLQQTRCMAIDMETATLFTAGFSNAIPVGSLLLVSDQPMISTGVKTDKTDKKVNKKYVDIQLKIGIDALLDLKNKGLSVKHLRF